MYKVRITYTKSKEAAYIPAKDLKTVIETAMVRAGIYIIYTKDNEPDIQFADNISLGIESTAEICDVALKEHVEPAFMIKGLNRELPVGMVVLTAEYLRDIDIPISGSAYAVTYEIIPNLGDITHMTNREYEDRRKWYRFRMEEYLSEPAILVLVKSMDRSERIDIKPAILSYEMHINDALRITISKDTEYSFNPNYIMDGFKEFVNDNIDYTIKRTKILF
ncbi:MAG: DUF2344 domain-containing protein [Clostridia bacterium]|nr:DUF2344 domain-containing protein [Clostridia bacterium]